MFGGIFSPSTPAMPCMHVGNFDFATVVFLPHRRQLLGMSRDDMLIKMITKTLTRWVSILLNCS